MGLFWGDVWLIWGRVDQCWYFGPFWLL